MTHFAVIGAAGQLGSELMRVLGDAAIPLGHADIELTDPARISTALDGGSLGCVINCAAYNLVDRAEAEPEAAFAVNAFGVRNLARWCGTHDVPLLHVSTDYVFGLDAERSVPYGVDDPTGTVSAYGASKLAGENFVRSHCARHWVVRTCGLYGRNAARGKGNFVETMLRLGRERPELRIVADQVCTPTSAADLANALAALVKTEDYGVYHATNACGCSWFDFASEIFQCASLTPVLKPITAAAYGAAARRPAYSVLDYTRLTDVCGYKMRPWQEALREYIATGGE
ncbi:MAG: dTDP-4-dehydrorhamnose reductase [Planctomycetales bacterium 12-60-4]|nr:MAG: dTDP-4-dehydrorhamnose reductase [Planctomycetales bacterium 12-60-4]